MSVEHLALVLHHSRAKGTDKLVLLGIANHEGDGGAWPTVATLAKYAGTSERQVQRSIAKLVGRGELVVDAQAGGDLTCPDHRRPNRYRVTVACPASCDRTPNHRDLARLAGPQLRLSTRVTPTSPHPSHGVTPTSPGGVTPMSPKPPIPTTTQQVVARPQDTRACQECGNPEARCQRVQAAWPAADRHSYRPVSRG